MNLCSDNHDEVCYEGRDCPVCKEQSTVREMDAQISNLEDQIVELNKEIKNNGL